MHQANNPQIISIERNSPRYPVRLLDLSDPPDTLYLSGEVFCLNAPMIAIVGSRKPTAQGIKNAIDFSQTLSKAGFLVISGMARGIDGAAHSAVLGLGTGHPTVAVCGTGLDSVYPPEHHTLAKSIRRQGLLISELAPGIGPKPYHFPRRNRIIAALSLGVVVVEAAQRSGSLITARLACELGREVFAIPGSIHSPLSRGCHQLIQQGAKLVQNPEDVLVDLQIYSKNLFKNA
jgi:DNA processing protein